LPPLLRSAAMSALTWSTVPASAYLMSGGRQGVAR
jgi:hypothetical protein